MEGELESDTVSCCIRNEEHQRSHILLSVSILKFSAILEMRYLRKDTSDT